MCLGGTDLPRILCGARRLDWGGGSGEMVIRWIQQGDWFVLVIVVNGGRGSSAGSRSRGNEWIDGWPDETNISILVRTRLKGRDYLIREGCAFLEGCENIMGREIEYALGLGWTMGRTRWRGVARGPPA